MKSPISKRIISHNILKDIESIVMSHTVIDINFIDEDDLYNIDFKSTFITLDPKGIIYRGYDDRYSDVNTLKWYYPRQRQRSKKTCIKRRAIFFGSFQHAAIYTANGGIPLADRIPKRGTGPIYRFWSKRPLKLWSLNYTNVQIVINHFLQQNSIQMIFKLIYAFGYLYNNLWQSLNLIDYMAENENLTNNEKVHVNDLKMRLIAAANTCLEQCHTSLNSKHRIVDNVGSHSVEEIEKFCYDQCWFRTSQINRLERKSLYEVDKPLIECLDKYLSPDGYDGIFAWNFTENDYIQWKYHDIIIFDPPSVLISDNVDVNNLCPNPTISVCPKRTIPVKIPIKRTINGKNVHTRRQD